MNATTPAYAVLGTLIFAVGMCGVFFRRGVISALLSAGVAACGPIVAVAGFSAAGGSENPAYGDGLALAMVATVSVQLLLGVAIAMVAWRHERAIEVDDFDEVAT